MWPRPGMMLNITATASLALPSAVCVAPRIQSHRSHLSASLGRRWPQYGHGILSPGVDFGAAAGASVYSTFILIETHKPHRIRQANRIQNQEHHGLHGFVGCFDLFVPARSAFGLPVYVARVPAAPLCQTPFTLPHSS